MANRSERLRELLERRRLRRDSEASPERERERRDQKREERRERRQRIVERIAALIGIAGGHFTGANWVGKAITVAILSLAAAVVKWIFTS